MQTLQELNTVFYTSIQLGHPTNKQLQFFTQQKLNNNHNFTYEHQKYFCNEARKAD